MQWGTRSVSSRRKTRGRCVRSSVSSAGGLCERKLTDSIITPPRLRAKNGAAENHGVIDRRNSNRDCPEIHHAEAATRFDITAAVGRLAAISQTRTFGRGEGRFADTAE